MDLNRRRSTGKAEREFLDARVAISESAMVKAENVLASFLSANRSTSASPELQATRSRFERRVSLREQALNGLTQALESARTEEIRNTPVITVVERPEDSVEPVGRGTIVKTSVALIVGTAVALMVFLLRETAPPRGTN